ncbi:MAG: type II secretion system protein E [Thermomicrobiales bacterium]
MERDHAEPRSLPWLIATGTLGAAEAAILSLAVEMRRSVIVAAAEDKAGKTTLLTALLQFMDPSTRPVYIRGIYERFEYLSQLDPVDRYVLCNEISAHLPTYLWGRGVRNLFAGLGNGFPLATTMHAGSSQEAIDALQSYPLEVPPQYVTGIDLIVTLRKGMVDGHQVRRVVAVDRIRERRGVPDLQQLAVRDPMRAAPQIFSGRMVAAIAAWGNLTDNEASRLLASQERFLAESTAEFANDPQGFSQALERFRSGN